MKLSINEIRKVVRKRLVEGVTIQFRPDEVNHFVQIAVEFSGGKYEYNPKGSRVAFSGKQFSEFVDILQQALNDELIEPDEKAQVQSTLNHVMQQLPSA